MLSQLPVSCGNTLPGEPRKLWKEKHFFDNGECASGGAAACYGANDSLVPSAGLEAARAHYFSHYPACGPAASRPLPPGTASLDATPRYMRVSLAPLRVRALYGEELFRKITLVLILRDPETRAWSWFRFFALNAVEGKPWARDQLEQQFWFHFNNASFRRWAVAQIAKLTACKARGVATSDMWPKCDSETGMFAGLYTGQIRRWLDAGFDPARVVVIPMDCYVGKGPAASLSLIGAAAGLRVGKGLGSLDRRFAPENEKRLRQITASGDGTKASAANRHGEQPIPVTAAKQLKAFFRHEGSAVAELLRQHPAVRVVDCGLPHFFRPCNASACLPTHDEAMAALDAALVAYHASKEAGKETGSWRRAPLATGRASGGGGGDSDDDGGGGNDDADDA